MSESEPPHEIVLWGATGFTGRLVAEHLADRYAGSDLRWAIAGRDGDELESLRAALAERDPDVSPIPVLTADAFDRGSLEALAERTAVVCSTVGPYSTYGTNLIDACVERGTDYCDLAGEIHWIRRMIDRHHEEARASGTRIVHSCGFDSVPSDIGVLAVQRAARKRHGAPCTAVKSFVRYTGGEMSGGTAASLGEMFEAASTDPEARRALRNPYSLAPEGERAGVDDGAQRIPRYDADLREWTAPFIMAAINERVVRRTNALLGYPWGREFRYDEALSTGTGLRGGASSAGSTVSLGMIRGAMAVRPLRNVLEKYVFPEPGEGPDRTAIEGSSFDVRFVGEGRDAESGEPFTVEATVAGDRDLGYGATARMVGESAVCLAKNETDTPLEGGILTPASGIGLPLADRLRDVGTTVTVHEDRGSRTTTALDAEAASDPRSAIRTD